MPDFDFATPEPILVTVGLDIGRAHISAGDGIRTTVDVRPSDSSSPCDLATARLARVSYADGELVVTVTKAQGVPGDGSVVVDITVPGGSRLDAEALAADFYGRGRFGECRIAAGCGHVRLDETGPLHLSSVLGNVTVERVVGDVQAVAGSGDVSIREINGSADIDRSTGNTRIGEVTGDVRVYADSGDLHIGLAHAGVEARAAQGDIRIDETVRGSLVLETASGKLDIGISSGTEATLHLDAHVGTVYRSLDLLEGADPEAEPEESVEVHARTIIGDIVVRRASIDHDAGWP
jgi:hypothetical protein